MLQGMQCVQIWLRTAPHGKHCRGCKYNVFQLQWLGTILTSIPLHMLHSFPYIPNSPGNVGVKFMEGLGVSGPGKLGRWSEATQNLLASALLYRACCTKTQAYGSQTRLLLAESSPTDAWLLWLGALGSLGHSGNSPINCMPGRVRALTGTEKHKA